MSPIVAQERGALAQLAGPVGGQVAELLMQGLTPLPRRTTDISEHATMDACNSPAVPAAGAHGAFCGPSLHASSRHAQASWRL